MPQFATIWFNLPIAKKVSVIAATIGVFLAILTMAKSFSSPSMALLFSGLEPGAAGDVVRSLEARGTQFQVRGSSIYVAARERDELRMTLASDGLPLNGSSGYELLDSLSGFGTTSQMFDAAYWRAKEGELARTIAANPKFASARVHISNTRSNSFNASAEPTASVSVTPHSGRLTNGQALAMRNLIASAVAGLSPDNVVVIGRNGEILGSTRDTSLISEGETRALALKKRAERLLEARVGPGNAIVEVSLETVTEREEIREKILDPDGRIAISTDTEEQQGSSSNNADGQVSVASNLPDGDANTGVGETSETSSLNRERINYEVSETQRNIVRLPGALKQLSVAILVNGIQTQDETGQNKWEPRGEEELSSLKELVSSAVGFNADRGDIITIKSMVLAPVEPAGVSVNSNWMSGVHIDVMSAIQMLVLAIVALILGLFVIKPLMSSRRPDTVPPLPLANTLAEETAVQLPDLVGTSELNNSPDSVQPIDLALNSGELPPLPTLSDMQSLGDTDSAAKLKELIDERQSETVEILRGWLETSEEPAR